MVRLSYSSLAEAAALVVVQIAHAQDALYPYAECPAPLPKFLTSNPLPDGTPWGSSVTNPSDPPPNTGVTRSYNWTIARQTFSPDGFQKSGILINGQFPGPMIEANYGDYIEVTVTNEIGGPEEGTAIHWHGLLQSQTPWADGVPGIEQCPIAPGSSFTYRFQADVYGTTWYHAHYSGQYADGLVGPLVIHGPTYYDYDVDVGPIILSDWYHKNYQEVVDAVSGNDSSQWGQAYQNTFINGRNPYDCTLPTNFTDRPCTNDAPMTHLEFQQGKTHLLRLVNVAGAGLMKFTIDDHTMTVVSNDFVPVQPYNASVITLGVGQRTDILVYGSGDASSSYWMRNNQSTVPCARADATSVNSSLAIIHYEDAPQDLVPTSTSDAPYLGGDVGEPILAKCTNDAFGSVTPYYHAPLPTPDLTYTLLANQPVNATGNQIFTMNGNEFRSNYNDPLLFHADTGNLSFAPESAVENIGDATSVRVILNSNNSSPHPMHLHGHNFYVLAEGEGTYNPDNDTIVNPQNPLRRDTYMVRPYGFLVIQFDAGNPGVWPYHCHIFTHLSTGFNINFLERPDALLSNMKIPDYVPQTCDAWDAWSKNHIVDEVDSGI